MKFPDVVGEIRTLIVSGPNEGGKSTYMRSIGVAAFMAHIGSFVACSEARIPIIDGIYTRMGAEDRLFEGKSTFAVEMEETNLVLKVCVVLASYDASAVTACRMQPRNHWCLSMSSVAVLRVTMVTVLPMRLCRESCSCASITLSYLRRHLTSVVRCVTIFATHFEELGIMLQIQLPRQCSCLVLFVLER